MTNGFELTLALTLTLAIVLFGLNSGAALVTMVYVTEKRMLVVFANRVRSLFPTSEAG